MLATARRDLDLAVAEARMQHPPASWAEIGRATGMSRQAARERWATDGGIDAEGAWELEHRLRQRDTLNPELNEEL